MSLTFSAYNMGAVTKLFSKVDPDDTVLVVAVGSGGRLETPSGTYFIATIRDGNLMERVMVTRVTGDRLAVVRAQDGTTPQTFRAGSCLTVEWTAAAIKAIVAAATGETTTGFTGTLAAPAIGTYQNGLLIDATQGSGC